jgi:hypothetical protein
VCSADSETVCKCWDAQQRDSGVDWCQWANCACGALKDATLKQGICGLSTACGSIAALKQQHQALATQSAPAQLAAQVEQVRAGQIVDCSPPTCMAYGSLGARVAGALEMLKDGGKIADQASCMWHRQDPAAFDSRYNEAARRHQPAPARRCSESGAADRLGRPTTRSGSVTLWVRATPRSERRRLGGTGPSPTG